MRNNDKGRGRQERYVKLRYWLLNSQAWNSLSGNARALYVELAQRYNGSNNGRIPYSVREAKQSLHISSDTASRLLEILQARGFIVCTKKGAFSLKTTKDASEWRLTEYDCDYPVAHATKDFMRWNPPEGVAIDTRQPSHHRKSKARYLQSDRMVPPVGPYGTPSRTVNGKNRQNGTPSRTVKPENPPSTVPPVGHLQLPGGGGDDADGVATASPPALEPAPAPASLPAPPWVPYSQRDIDHDRHSREGLMVYVADVIETQLRNVEAKEVRGAHGIKGANRGDDDLDPPPDLQPPPAVFPAAETAETAKTRPPALVYGLAGDRHREAVRDRNREALQRWERRMIIDKPTS
jgi:hypothetical protein